ncbi:MAG: PEP-CTERM sorting domain-containing protein [Sedimentisphaerales bacterium]|nr:PEP-CTERM sorting domain-containing protein [Sedimentisphaerales bacterium]
MKKQCVVMMLAIGLMSVSAASAALVTVAADTFTVTTERPSGSFLVGQTTEVGGLTWLGEITEGKDRYTLTENSDVDFGGGGAADQMASLPYTVNPAGEVVTIQANVLYPDDATDTFYAGVAFNLAEFTPDTNWLALWKYVSIGLRVQRSGSVELFGENEASQSTGNLWTSTTLTGGAIALNTWVTISLEFDSAASTVNAWVGSEQVFNDEDILMYDADFSSADIGWAGFSIRDDANGYNGRVDDFQLKSTNPIPEPATLILLALGGGALLRRRNK